MIKHIILWQLSDELTAEEKLKTALAAKKNLEGLKGKIEGLEDIGAIGIVLDSERRCGTLREHLQTLYQNLDVTSIHLWVLALTLAYHTLYLDAVFASQLVGCIT